MECYVGIPYVSGGESPQGCDCWGLVRRYLADEFGKRVPSRAEVVQQVSHPDHWRVIRSLVDTEAGDVLLFTKPGGEKHVGVAISDCRMLHACEGIGSVIERYDTTPWVRLWTRSYRPV